MMSKNTPRVFLSASIPPPDINALRKHPDAWEDVYLGYGVKPGEIENAIRGIVPPLLTRSRAQLVFGAHPAITPIVTDLGRLLQRSQRITIQMFVSAYFAGQEAFDQRHDKMVYDHIQWVPICRPGPSADKPEPVSDLFPLGEHPLKGESPLHQAHQLAAKQLNSLDNAAKKQWLSASLAYMRELMIKDCDAAIFVGGMQGIEDELKLFRALNPKQPYWLITRPGGRTTRIADRSKDERFAECHIVEEWVYERVGEAVWNVIDPKIRGISPSQAGFPKKN